jgi:hypothetical protein
MRSAKYRQAYFDSSSGNRSAALMTPRANTMAASRASAASVPAIRTIRSKPGRARGNVDDAEDDADDESI